MKPRSRLPGGETRHSPPDPMRQRPGTDAKVKLREQGYHPRWHPRAAPQPRRTLTRPEPELTSRPGRWTCLNGFGLPLRVVPRADAVENLRQYLSLVDIPPNNRQLTADVSNYPATGFIVSKISNSWLIIEAEIHFAERPVVSLHLRLSQRCRRSDSRSAASD